LLGRHVLKRPDDGALDRKLCLVSRHLSECGGQRSRARLFRQAKIHQLGPAFRKHDVRRLEIAMRDAHLVGLGQRIGNLHRNADRLLRRQGSPDQLMLQRFPLDQFHDEKVHAILMTNVMQGADVRVRKFGDGFGFALESLPQRRIRGQVGG
jgi:hypothetical protein